MIFSNEFMIHRNRITHWHHDRPCNSHIHVADAHLAYVHTENRKINEHCSTTCKFVPNYWEVQYIPCSGCGFTWFLTTHKFILEPLISNIFTQKILAGTVWLDPKWKVLNDDPDHLPPEYLQSPCRYLVSVQVSNSVLSVYKEPVIKDYPSHWLVTLSSIRFIIAKRCW